MTADQNLHKKLTYQINFDAATLQIMQVPPIFLLKIVSKFLWHSPDILTTHLSSMTQLLEHKRPWYNLLWCR